VDPSFKEQNIETTSGGKYFPDEVYAQDFAVGPEGRSSGSYLRTLTYREFLGKIISANAFVLARRGSGSKAVSYLEHAMRLNPQFADNYVNLAIGYRAAAKGAKEEIAQRYREKAEALDAKAKALGYVDAEQIALGRKTRGGLTQ
jgi:hypothetical protein